MQFEIHITVESKDIEGWKALCKKLFLKPLWIQNSKGWRSRQMLCAAGFSDSARNIHNERLGVRSHMKYLSDKINSVGFKVIRQKLKCGFRKMHSFLYNECHIKITLPDSENEAVLSFCELNGISASWSLIHNVSGKRKWYLTVRD